MSVFTRLLKAPICIDHVCERVTGRDREASLYKLFGRVEFAKTGGKLNADYIDNSGGVDASDHEVNIKIMLAHAMSRKENNMSINKRNILLESMTDEIADLVLANNYQQAQAISLMMLDAPEDMPSHSRLIRNMELNHGLNRDLESLPSKKNIEERMQNGEGLNRPEISLLQSYTKINLSKDLLDSDIPDLPEMSGRLFNYFPKPLRRKNEKEILNHRLKREIIATTLATSVVNRMGPAFINELINKTGSSCADIIRAYIIVRESFQLSDIWHKIEALDGQVSAQTQLRAMKEISKMVERETSWFLTSLGRDLDIATDISKYKNGISILKQNLSDVVTKDLDTSIKQRIKTGTENGLPKALAREIALIPTMGSACDIIRTSIDHKADILLTACIYFELGEHLHINLLRQQAGKMTADDHWSAEALQSVIDQLNSNQASLTARVINDQQKLIKQNKPEHDGKALVRIWGEKHSEQTHRLDPLIADMSKAGTIDLPMLIIAEQRLRKLCGV